MPTISRLQLAVGVTGAARAHAELEALDNRLNRLDEVWRNRVARFVTDRDREGNALSRVTLVAEQANIRQSRAVDRNVDHHRRFGGILGTLLSQMVRMSSRAVLLASIWGGLATVAFQLGSALVPVVGLAGSLPGLLIGGGVAAATAGLAFNGMGDALKAMSQAQDGSKASLEKLKEAMAALPPAARPVVRQLFEMRGMMRQLRETAAAGIMPGVSNVLRGLSGLFPIFQRVVAATSRELGALGDRLARLTRLQSFRRDLAAVLGDSARLTRNFGNAGIYLAQALMDVAAAARPMTLAIGAAVERAAAGFARFTETARASGAMSRFFDAARRTAGQLWGILGDLVTIIFNLGRIAAPAGQGLLDMLATVLDRAARASRNLDNLRRTVMSVADAAIVLKAALLGAAFGPWGLAAGVAAGALLVLYRRSAEFRQIVGRIGSAIMDVAVPAFRSLVGWVQGQFLPAILRVIPFVRDQLGQGFRSLSRAISDNRAEFALVGRIIITVAGWILTRLVPVLIRLYAVYLRSLFEALAVGVRAFGGMVRAIQGAWQTVQRAGRIIGDVAALIGRIWNTLVGLSRGAWSAFRQIVFDNVMRVRQEIVKSIVGLIPRHIREGWGSSNRATSEALGRFRANVAEAMRRALGTIQGWVRSVLSAARGMAAPLLTAGRNAWSSLMRGIRSIDIVAGIKGLLNSGLGLIERFGRGIASVGNRLLPGAPIRFPPVPRLQQGGTVPGEPRGDRVPLLAEGGEFMVRQPVAEALRPMLEAINRLPASSARVLARELATSRRPDFGGDPSALIVSRRPMLRADREGVTIAMQRGGVVPPGGGGRQPIRAGLIPLINRTQQWIRAQDPKPYIWGGVGPGGYDCSGLTGAVYGLLTGQSPHRRYFTTGNMPGSSSMRPGRGAYTVGVTSGSGHMAGNLAGLPFEARGSSSGIIVGGGARSVMSFARQFYLPQVGGQFIGGGGIAAGLAAIFERLLRGVTRPILGALGRMGGPSDLTGRIVAGVGTQLVNSVVNWVRGMFTFAAGPGGPRGPVAGGALSPAERWIIMRESGNRTTADNPSSTAFGLGQLLIGNRQHYGRILGVSPDTTDYNSQLQMFRMYVRDRYGTAERAKAFWESHGWYRRGLDTVVNQPTMIGVGEAGPERVQVTPMGRGAAGAGGLVVNFHAGAIRLQGTLAEPLTSADVTRAVQEGIGVAMGTYRRFRTQGGRA